MGRFWRPHKRGCSSGRCLSYLLPGFARRYAALVVLWAWTPDTHLQRLYPLSCARDAPLAAVVTTERVPANAYYNNGASVSHWGGDWGGGDRGRSTLDVGE